EHGQISWESSQIDAPNLTRAIAEGDSTGTATAIAEATNAEMESKWGIPMEAYFGGSGSDVTALSERALNEIGAGAEQSGFSVTPRDDISSLAPSMLGGRVAVAVGDTIREARLNQITLALSVDGVHVSATL
ncbi:hypothetical protein SB658_22140, partial [Bacillus sp. SIMBA_008]|uniref:hypothetical protein n=1 Tax=Bacillus sp. SIMBA_008 TaxID=3085757 RepID=UPI00397A28A7